MIMRIVRQTEVYLSEFRSQLASDLEEYETRRRTTHVLRDGLRYDDTPDRIEVLKQRLAMTDNLIETYQEFKNA
jgi:hypothetical protein